MLGNIGFGFELGYFLPSAQRTDRHSRDLSIAEQYRYNMIRII